MSKADIAKLDLRKPVLAKNARTIHASYDTWTQWKQDPLGYWLFRVDPGKNEIHAGFCTKKNIIEVVIVGCDGEAMYNTIVREKLVTSLQHAAYVGYELHKAEVSLKLGIPYVQDRKHNLSGVRHEHQ